MKACKQRWMNENTDGKSQMEVHIHPILGARSIHRVQWLDKCKYPHLWKIWLPVWKSSRCHAFSMGTISQPKRRKLSLRCEKYLPLSMYKSQILSAWAAILRGFKFSQVADQEKRVKSSVEGVMMETAKRPELCLVSVDAPFSEGITLQGRFSLSASPQWCKCGQFQPSPRRKGLTLLIM